MGAGDGQDKFRQERIAVVDELATLSESLSAMSKVMASVGTSGHGPGLPEPREACLLAGTLLGYVSGDLSRVADDVDRLRAAAWGYNRHGT